MANIDLTENQRRFLRGRAHALKPVIQIGGKGLTDYRDEFPRKDYVPGIG